MRHHAIGNNLGCFHTWLPDTDLRFISSFELKLLEDNGLSPGIPDGIAVNVPIFLSDCLSPRAQQDPSLGIRVVHDSGATSLRAPAKGREAILPVIPVGNQLPVGPLRP
jgi:hypothetical protein